MAGVAPTERARDTGAGLTLVLALVTLALDQLSKFWAVRVLVGRPRPVVPGLCDLWCVPNAGALGGLFSAGAGSGLRWGLIALGLVTGLLVWRWGRGRGGSRRRAVAVGCLLGGLLSNTVDRMIWGYVIDYMRIYAGAALGVGTFNPADLAIIVGVALLMPDLRAHSAGACASEPRQHGRNPCQ